jgi:polyribonucleotide nucleotidyltransferase
LNDEDQQTIALFLDEKIPSVLFDHKKATKRERGVIIDQLKESLDAYLTEKQMGKEKREKAKDLVKDAVLQAVSSSIIKTGKRVDGRSLEDIRPLQMEIGVFARTHGSAHFSRGETQVVSIITLGSPSDVQLLDTMEVEEKKYFMHHYNFPPFSVGEVRPLRGPGRRDIGHGALAEKALRAVLPPRDTFPYTIRIVSEVLSSNGSSSMASACGSSLALMDAGVPIKHHVAGIAMGVATDGKGAYTVFTDLQDLEDGPGGMDFKICGTADGITAIQMDTKTDGLPIEVVQETFAKARAALNKLFLEMSSVIPASRPDLSVYAPRIYTLHIDPEKIGLLIGPGGKTINKIIEKTGVDIDIEKDGTVLVTAVKKEGANAAIKEIENLTRVVKVGEEYTGKVTRVMDFGAFVELTPSQEGMVHVSNLSNEFVRNVSDVVKIGDTLNVKVIEIDEQGRINLSVVGVEIKTARGGDRGNNSRGNFRKNDRRRQY